MASPELFYAKWSPRVLSILRIVGALLFMQHGAQKLFGFPPPARAMPPFELFSMFGIAGVLEFFGGFLLALGLFTRPVAFLLSGEMAVAYFRSHFPKSFWPVLNAGEPAILFCFLFLFFAVAGGGVWSLDRIWRVRVNEVRV